MLGQKTISPGPMAPCPTHTFRKARTAYPLLCVPVKHPNPILQESRRDPDRDNYDEEIDEPEKDFDDYSTYKITRSRISFAPLPKYTENNNKLKTRPTISRKSKVIGYLVIGNDKKTSSRFIDTFEQDLDLNTEEEQAVTLGRHQYLQTRILYSDIRKEQERGERNWSSGDKKRRLTFEDEFTRPESYRRRIIAQTDEDLGHGGFRHRWQQIRTRPQRPGANALLKILPKLSSHRPRVASMMLDKEDVNQLFIDTGFNVNWRQQPLQQ